MAVRLVFQIQLQKGFGRVSNTTVATVDTNGIVTGISAGSAIISYTVTYSSFPAGTTCTLSVDEEVIVNNCISCYKSPVDQVEATQFTEAGISTMEGLQKENWPENIPNGFLALESTNKGFVISRVSHVSETPDLVNDAIKDPKEGMLVYDIQDDCVKLYNGTVWKCIFKNCN